MIGHRRPLPDVPRIGGRLVPTERWDPCNEKRRVQPLHEIINGICLDPSAFMAWIDHRRYQSARCQEADCPAQRRYRRLGARRDSFVTVRAVPEVEHQTSNSTAGHAGLIAAFEHPLVADLEEVDPIGKPGESQPAPCLIQGDRLHVKPVNMTGTTYESSQQFRVMTVAYRPIYHNVPAPHRGRDGESGRDERSTL
jgi:hypothetical protein